MLKGIMIPLFLFVFCCGYAQNEFPTTALDSVAYYIEKSKEPHFSEDIKLLFAEKSLQIAEKDGGNESIVSAKLNLVTFLYSRNDTLDRVHQLFSDLDNQTSNSSNVLRNRYWYKRGDFYRFMHFGDSAFYFYNKGLKGNIGHDYKCQSKVGYYKIARLLFEYGAFIEAKKNVLLGIDVQNIADDFKITNKLYLLKSTIESKMGNTKQAYSDLIFVRNQAMYFGDSKSKALVYNKLGVSLLSKKVFDSAFYYFEKGIAIKKRKNYMDKEHVSLLSNRNYAVYKLKKNQLFFKECARYSTICKQRGFDDLLFTIEYRLAKVYQERGEYASSRKQIGQAIKHFSSDDMEDLYTALLLAAELHEPTAVKYTSKYLRISDSIHFLNKGTRTRIAKIKFDVARKEALNLVLKGENVHKNAVLEKEQFNNIITGLTLLAIALTFITISYVVIQRRKKQVYLGKLERADAREFERQRLAKKLHDEILGDLTMLHLKLQKTPHHKMVDSVSEIKEIVRDLSHELSSVSFEDVSFKDQIINVISENFEMSFPVKVHGLNDVVWTDLPSPIKRVLYISVLNIIRNSTGIALEINFSFLDDTITLKVAELNASAGLKKLPYFTCLTQRIQEIYGKVVFSKVDKNQYVIIIPIINI